MHTAFYIFSLESCFLKNRSIRQEIYFCSGFSCFSKFWKKTIYQLYDRISLFISVMVDIAVTADLHIHIYGQCIYNRRTYTVQTSACLICRVIELTTGMKRCIDKTLCRHTFGMHIDRHTTSIICNRGRTVFFQCDMNLAAVSCQMFIYRIIYNLIDQMVQTFCRYASDIHSRSFSYRFQTF